MFSLVCNTHFHFEAPIIIILTRDLVTWCPVDHGDFMEHKISSTLHLTPSYLNTFSVIKYAKHKTGFGYRCNH